MAQLTIRLPEDVVERLKSSAEVRDMSMNSYVSAVLGAATDPQYAGNEAARLRERLTLAGLLEAPAGPRRARPSRRRAAVARTAAGKGTPLSGLIDSGRG